jgi:hypothetical protein
MRFDGSNGTGIAIAHDDHVGRLIPPFPRFAACRRMPAHCRIRLTYREASINSPALAARHSW